MNTTNNQPKGTLPNPQKAPYIPVMSRMKLEAARGQDGRLPSIAQFNSLVKIKALIGSPI